MMQTRIVVRWEIWLDWEAFTLTFYKKIAVLLRLESTGSF